METQLSTAEVIAGELDKIRAALADYPQLHAPVFPCLDQIKAAAEAALPCPVMPAISMKDYVEQLPEPAELMAAVAAAGSHYIFHGYTFWAEAGQRWSLTNPHGMDDVMTLNSLADFEKFLLLLRQGVIICGD